MSQANGKPVDGIPDAELSITLGASEPIPFETLTDMVLDIARKNYERPAVRGPRRRRKPHYVELSYGQLVWSAHHVAERIAALVPADLITDARPYVAILLPRTCAFPVAALGVLMAGAAYLPCYESLPADRLRHYLSDSGAAVLVTTRKLHAIVKGFYAGKVVYVEDAYHGPGPVPAGEMPPRLPTAARAAGSTLAYMIYTSGTTGKPKGVQIEHRGVVNMLHHHRTRLVGRDDTAKSVLVAALIFDSSVRETWLPLVSGGTLCVAEGVFEITEGTMCAGTPSGLTVARFPPTLRTVMVGGERLTPACVANINKGGDGRAKKVINAYGPTETTVECLMHVTDATKPDEIPLIGTPISNVHCYGVPQGAEPDAETGKWPIARKGEPCELFVGGVGIARGYRNLPAKTAAKFLPNPFGQQGRVYRTGDLVRWTPSGDLEYLGRTDSQVKLRGFRIELDEVERVCGETPGVEQVVVVLAKNPRRGDDHLVAYVTPETVAPEAVQAAAAAKMPNYMVPTLVVPLASFPSTIGGKVDKRALPAPPWPGGAADPAAAANGGASASAAPSVEPPRKGLEQAILNAVCEILELNPATVCVNASLFEELGLTSIDAAVLRGKLVDAGIDNVESTATILRHPSVRALAAHLNGDGPQNAVEEKLLQAVACLLDCDPAELSCTDNIFETFGLTSIARRDSAEHFFRSNALHCTATALILIPAECSAIS